MIALPAWGLNRFNYTSPAAFAAAARRAESLGWDYAVMPYKSSRCSKPNWV